MVDEIAVSLFVARRVQRRIGFLQLQPSVVVRLKDCTASYLKPRTLELLSLNPSEPLTWPCRSKASQ
jgi:hypothetical protein